MVDIYSRPDLYNAIHKTYSWDKQLITSAAEQAGGPVLELAAGTGRLAQLILDLGLDYTGIDLSDEFIRAAQEKYGEVATFHIGDMQQFKMDLLFKFIFIGFNSFLHNLTDRAAINCLSCVRNHLDDSGQFLVSIFIPDPSFLYRDETQLFPATSIFELEGDSCRIMETNRFNEETQINKLSWQLERNGELESNVFEFTQRMFYPHNMDILFDEADLKIVKKMGDYDGTPMDEESGMQIYVCEKA